MKIAVIKPDYGIIGGFEIVVDRIVKGLIQYGHVVDYLKVDMTKHEYILGDITIPQEIYHQNQEFFRYTTSIKKFEELNLEGYDLVLSTQPPSFAINHDRVVILFYHHLKIYYDLFEACIESGLYNEELHKRSSEIVRAIDNNYITNNKHYIAGSEHVASRLRKFNNIKNYINIFSAGISDEYYNYNGDISYNYPICVGRHEFPKRPELFIHTMKHVNGLKGKVIGEGGKTEDLKKIDVYLTALHRNHEEINDDDLWKFTINNINSMNLKNTEKYTKDSNVIFLGKLSQNQLIKEYSDAMCVICPAYEEDYGLTAIEAMAFHKPVIACKDGGGYAEFIEHGQNGFIVEPSGEAIAEVINYLKDNPSQLRKMGENAYEFSRKYDWKNAIRSFNNILNTVV